MCGLEFDPSTNITDYTFPRKSTKYNSKCIPLYLVLSQNVLVKKCSLNPQIVKRPLCLFLSEKWNQRHQMNVANVSKGGS